MSKHIDSRIWIPLIGWMFLTLSGCSQRTAAVDDKTAQRSPSTTHETNEEFPLPAGGEGKMLAKTLLPSDQVPHMTDDRTVAPKRQSAPAKLESPDLPLPPAIANAPPSIPLEGNNKKGKAGQPKLLERESPLLRQRMDVDRPAGINLPPGPKVVWSSPDVNQPIPLPILARPVTDRASLDDPSGEASRAAALASSVPDRATPAPPLRLTLPDPFEHHNTIRLRTKPPEITLPADHVRPPGRQL
jgi:hypothetical protein